jgi:hypothetical protein
MAIGKDGKEIVVGSEDFVWDDDDIIAEFKERTDKAKKEIKGLPEGRKHLVFYLKKGYKTPYSINTRVLYKRTVTKFKTNGMPVFKGHYLTVKQGRIITSNSEEVAFLDMSKDFIRESERPLTPLEKEKQERMKLERELAILKAEKGQPKEEAEEDKKPKEEKVKDGSSGAKRKA